MTESESLASAAVKLSDPDTLIVDIRPSLILAGVLGALHVLALAAGWVSLAGWGAYLVLSGVALSAVASLAKALTVLPSAVLSLELRADGRASWRDRSGAWYEGALGTDHYVSPLLVVLRLKPAARGIRRLVLASDSASAEQLRRLRVWLRWQGEAGLGATPVARRSGAAEE